MDSGRIGRGGLKPWKWPLRTSAHPSFKKACDTKTKYSSEKSARLSGQNQIRQGNVPSGRLWPYACPNCRVWHLSKSASNGVSAITWREQREGVG